VCEKERDCEIVCVCVCERACVCVFVCLYDEVTAYRNISASISRRDATHDNEIPIVLSIQI